MTSLKPQVLVVGIVAALGNTACMSTTPHVRQEPGPLRVTVADEVVVRRVGYDYIARPRTRVTGLYKGYTPIDELDFYATAGDDDAVARILEWNTAYNRNVAIFMPLSIAGGASAIAGAGVLIYEAQTKPGGLSLSSSSVPLALALTCGGAVLAGIGGYGSMMSAPLDNTVIPGEHALRTAEQAAEQAAE